jgi:hypothetical protein
MVIWYILSRFAMLYQEKTGNPEVGKITELLGKSFLIAFQ